ncbi:MAG: hypothetical protein U9N38_03290 [Thermodesulfobacteriota bacterium]|nr:hypothetical protein [Thermodesulfobacteriota bacterium]
MEKECFVSKCGMVLFLMFFSLSSVLFSTSGCSDSDSSYSKTLVAGGVWSDDDGSGAIALVTEGDTDIENAKLTVNDVSLSYPLTLEFVTDSGIDVKVALPVYYADLGQLTSGDTVDLVAKNPAGGVFYQHAAVTIPGKATILQPVEGASINVNEDVTIQWNEGTNAEGYVAGYLDISAFDGEPVDDDDAGMYTEYVDASTTEATVPSKYTVAGDAMFSVEAVSGDTDIFTSEEDPTESFFIVGTSDWIEAGITADVTADTLATESQPAEDRASQGLKIAKCYKKRIDHITYYVCESDPNQIQYPGTVTLGFKFRKRKKAIAFVVLYDMQGKKYAEWSHVRYKKSHSKSYSKSFSMKPGATVIFGTHKVNYLGGTYTY